MLQRPFSAKLKYFSRTQREPRWERAFLTSVPFARLCTARKAAQRFSAWTTVMRQNTKMWSMHCARWTAAGRGRASACRKVMRCLRNAPSLSSRWLRNPSFNIPHSPAKRLWTSAWDECMISRAWSSQMVSRSFVQSIRTGRCTRTSVT
jgi:hypothetical protein